MSESEKSNKHVKPRNRLRSSICHRFSCGSMAAQCKTAPAPAEQPPARRTDGRADAWGRAELARLERFAPPPPDASSDEEL